MAECRIFVAFPSRLDDKVCKAPVKNRKKCIDMDLVKSPFRFPIRLKEGIRILRVPKDITGRPIAGNELVFSIVKIPFELGIKSKEEVPEGILAELGPLFAKSSFGRGRSFASKVTVKLLFYTFSLHGKQEDEEVLEPQFPVPCKVSARMFGIKCRVVSEFIDT